MQIGKKHRPLPSAFERVPEFRPYPWAAKRRDIKPSDTAGLATKNQRRLVCAQPDPLE